jgi:hypothetical protein
MSAQKRDKNDRKNIRSGALERGKRENGGGRRKKKEEVAGDESSSSSSSASLSTVESGMVAPRREPQAKTA